VTKRRGHGEGAIWKRPDGSESVPNEIVTTQLSPQPPIWRFKSFQ
jgi:hypothetical protein